MAKKKYTKWIVLAVIVVLGYLAYVAYQPPDAGDYDYPLIDTPKPVFGNENSEVVILEYGDIQCPACRAAHPVINQIKTEFEDRIQFQFIHTPLRSIHPRAQKAAEAAECANDQGQFFEYIDIAYENQHNLGDSALISYAGELGLDTVSFENCLKSGAKFSVVNQDYNRALQNGVQSTPTFVVNGEVVSNWQYQNFRQVILEALEA